MNYQDALAAIPSLKDLQAAHELAIRAEREKEGKKFTKREVTKAHNAARADRIEMTFKVNQSHPESPVHDDPIWNDKHPLYQTVNELIGRGVPADEAVLQARAGKVVLPKYLASEKQVSFIESLLSQREYDKVEVVEVDGKKVVRDTENGSYLGKKEASWAIDGLKAAPYKARPKVEAEAPVEGLSLTDLPSGYYAVPNGDTRLKVKVEHGKPGTRWDGWTFVKDGAEYGQQKRYGMQKPGQAYRGDIEDKLAAIIEDPQAAMAEYGRLTGTCGKCGRKLEDEESVARGIGPICANGF